MALADKLYITHIHHKWEDADTYFPDIEDKDWQMTGSERHSADENNPHDFTFAEYTRRKSKDKHAKHYKTWIETPGSAFC